MRAQFILDPIIIDLSTGEMFLSATYGNRIMKEEAGAVTTATFSSDGQYLYYMLYGNTAEFRTVLYRYNLQEKTTELCYSGSDLNYYPYLSETANGAFVVRVMSEIQMKWQESHAYLMKTASGTVLN